MLPNEKRASFGLVEDELIRIIDGNVFSRFDLTAKTYPITAVELLPPCVPGKIMGIGANYHSLLEAQGKPIPSVPKFFIKPTTSITATNTRIHLPNNIDNIVFEGEVGVVIGKECRHVRANRAHEYILGYTCFNDVTNVSMIQQTGAWGIGKGADTFSPMGPYILLTNEVRPLWIQSRLNGKLVQNDSTDGLIFNIPFVISYISNYMTLQPGDIIATGSPAGSIALKSGDRIEIEVEGIGTLHNEIIMEGEPDDYRKNRSNTSCLRT